MATTEINIIELSVVTIPRSAAGIVPLAQEFAAPPLNVFIGAEPLTMRKAVAFGLLKSFKTDALDLVSALGESMAVPDFARVAEVVADDDTGRRFVISILAGRDSSESAYDRSDV